MRILLVSADPGIDPSGTKGAAVHLRAVRRTLETRGHELVSVTGRGADPEHGWLPLSDLDRVVGEPGPFTRFDCVYERYSLDHLGGLAAARRLGVPLILEVNAPLVTEAGLHRPERLTRDSASVEATLWKEADRVITVSEPLLRIVAEVRDSVDGLSVVGNGFDPGLHPSPALVGEGDRRTMVFLGHPKPWHGADRIVTVLKRLYSRGCEADLLVVGGGPGAEAVRRLARLHGLGRFVRITGGTSPASAATLLAEAAFLIAPYPPIEPFYFSPLKIVEAMGAGVPVLTTDQGDLGRTIGGGGVLVDPSDDLALAQAAQGLLGDPAMRVRLGNAGRSRAMALHTWDAVGRGIESVLLDACGSPRS